jgi:uncharacterized protein
MSSSKIPTRMQKQSVVPFWAPIKRLCRTIVSLVVIANLVAAPLTASATDLPAIDKAAANFHDPNPQLEQLFRAGLLNTMKQTTLEPDGTVYVSTGDIPAEWLRDSSAQVRPYLYFASDPAVASLIRAVIARQAKYIRIDPYANAFKEDYARPIHERKYELDSLAYPIILAWTYWKQTGDKSIFTHDFSLAMDKVLDTLTTEQDHAKNSKYTFDTLSGNKVKHTGMIWTGFRPSDDPCKYNYLIPSEMMAVVALSDLHEIERDVYLDPKKAARVHDMRKQIQDGIQNYGIVSVPKFGYIYAYEVDGLGGINLIDDANIPSLLSAPYLGYGKAGDPIYQNTRRYILSKANINFAVGTIGSGIGSEHTPHGYIWPLALIMQGLTASTDQERQLVLKELLASDPGDHLLHESFDPNQPKTFTRVDFGWPNALFSEFMLVDFYGEKPLPAPDMSDLTWRQLSRNP